ncbi:hypothetical protein [Brevundimonas sp.]|jgi:hypothetical protein|uniref:hypothetical protein n=1 Tax=Brevundimonas sp. TaxID=1871086 RepID=UPI0037C100CD
MKLLENRLEAEREVRAMQVRILWAGCILNGAGLLALVQLVSQVDDPDYALTAMRLPFILMTGGLFVSGMSLAIGYLGLMHRQLDVTARHSGTNPENNEAEGKFWDATSAEHFRKTNRDSFNAIILCMVGFMLGSFGIMTGVFGSLSGHRLQPRDQTQTPERIMQGISLLRDLTSSDVPPAVSVEVRALAATVPPVAQPAPPLQPAPDEPGGEAPAQ